MDEVKKWLEAIQFDEYINNFKTSKIDGYTLLSMTENDIDVRWKFYLLYNF